jgi:3-hydroxyisobutyrate dehydrogenase-like beta-hydroxyacid dehydrogenase
MVGGDDEAAVERAVEVLSAMAESVFPAGPLGAGHAMKTLNNYVAAAGLIAAFDALLIGNRYGLDPETMLDVFNLGTAQNFSTVFVLKEQALSRQFESGFQLGLLVKDLGIATNLTETLAFESSMPAFLHERLSRAFEDLGDEHADHAAALLYWEKIAGQQLPPLRAATQA